MTALRKAAIVAARRTAVAPRNGAFRHLQADELAAPVIGAVLADAGISFAEVDQVILGNALYGGGNPARLAALRAGLPDAVPAMTIDTQCCSGLDAILLASRLVEAGAADCVLAGGMESFSRSAIRMRRPIEPGEAPVAYQRPPFSPWADSDPELTEAAADLARVRGYSREAQAIFAVESHHRAMAFAQEGGPNAEIVTVNDLGQDAFTRKLTMQAALRAPVIAGGRDTGITAATAAVEADAAALVLVMSEKAAAETGQAHCLHVLGGATCGGDPSDPALVTAPAIQKLATDLNIAPGNCAAIELMEAYASQAMATVQDLKLETARINRHGGALSRGHPIGASGAILAVRLFHDLKSAKPGQKGLAAIAAAGGLATTLAIAG